MPLNMYVPFCDLSSFEVGESGSWSEVAILVNFEFHDQIKIESMVDFASDK